MDSIAPKNAARISSPELTRIVFPSKNTITSATTIFAPEEIPKTKGPAMGLWKKVCNRYPASASAPPRIPAASVRGKRISHKILAFMPSWVLPVVSISVNGIFTVPIPILQSSSTRMPAVNRTNAMRYLIFLRCCMFFSFFSYSYSNRILISF